MDLGKYADENIVETAVIELNDERESPWFDENGKRIWVELWGPGSRQYAIAQAQQSNRMIDKLKRRGKSEYSADDKSREQAEYLAACTVRFSEAVTLGDLTGRKLHEAIYGHPKLGFIAEQVAEHLGKWSNFTKDSTTT